MLGVAAMLPLMQLMTGADVKQGFLGELSAYIGTEETQALILVVAGFVAFAFVLKSVVTIIFRWWLLGHTTSLEAEASAQLMRRYVLSPYSVHRMRNVSEIYRNISSSIPQTFSQVVLGLIGILADLLTLVAVGAVLMVVSPTATIFTVVFFFMMGWGVQKSLAKRHLRIGRAIAQTELDGWKALMPGMDGFRELRLTSSAELFVQRFGRAKIQRANANRVSSLISELPRYVLEVGFVVGIAGISILLFATVSPEEAVSILGVFAAASTRMLPTLNRVVATIGIIRAGRVGLSIVAREVDALDEAGSHSENVSSASGYAGDIILDSINFTYKDAIHPVLADVSTTIKRGKTTAFVGSSGAGKSTLLDILLGLLPPTSGSVRCGDRDVYEDLPRWYESIGVVPQDVYLLDDTLAANIAFGCRPEDIDILRLGEAVELAQLMPLLRELPDGLETTLGERGVRLSGGQRQRVGIARALYRRPSILILDEATSSLDNVTEQKISETLESLNGTMTIVLVAHRLSTVKNADKVVFMAEGNIQAEGSFEEVEQRNADFANLVSLGRLS